MGQCIEQYRRSRQDDADILEYSFPGTLFRPLVDIHVAGKHASLIRWQGVLEDFMLLMNESHSGSQKPY